MGFGEFLIENQSLKTGSSHPGSVPAHRKSVFGLIRGLGSLTGITSFGF